jgi:hypothetical protein
MHRMDNAFCTPPVGHDWPCNSKHTGPVLLALTAGGLHILKKPEMGSCRHLVRRLCLDTLQAALLPAADPGGSVPYHAQTYSSTARRQSPPNAAWLAGRMQNCKPGRNRMVTSSSEHPLCLGASDTWFLLHEVCNRLLNRKRPWYFWTATPFVATVSRSSARLLHQASAEVRAAVRQAAVSSTQAARTESYVHRNAFSPLHPRHLRPEARSGPGKWSVRVCGALLSVCCSLRAASPQRGQPVTPYPACNPSSLRARGSTSAANPSAPKFVKRTFAAQWPCLNDKQMPSCNAQVAFSSLLFRCHSFCRGLHFQTAAHCPPGTGGVGEAHSTSRLPKQAAEALFFVSTLCDQRQPPQQALPAAAFLSGS